MAKKKAVPQHAEPDYESENQDIPEEEPARVIEAEPNPRPSSQTEMVRQALAAGHEKPATGVDFIKRQFGAEVDPKYYSVAKGQIRKREAANGGQAAPKGKPGRKAKTWQSQKDAPPVEHYFTPAPVAESGGEAGLIEALEAMKPLVAQFGADKVKRLVDLLG